MKNSKIKILRQRRIRLWRKSSKLKRGDEVMVTSGKDKGKTGKIEKVFSKENKVLVLGVNLYKRHIKARSQREKSDVVTKTLPLPISNVALICPNCRKETRVGFSRKARDRGSAGKTEGKEKFRICRKCGKKI